MHKSSIVIILALFVATPASAVNLGAAKTNGQVCEQTNGYLTANAGAPGDVQEMVKNINAQRRAEYEKIAQKNQVTVDQVAKLTAEKVINLAPQHRCK